MTFFVASQGSFQPQRVLKPWALRHDDEELTMAEPAAPPMVPLVPTEPVAAVAEERWGWRVGPMTRTGLLRSVWFESFSRKSHLCLQRQVQTLGGQSKWPSLGPASPQDPLPTKSRSTGQPPNVGLFWRCTKGHPWLDGKRGLNSPTMFDPPKETKKRSIVFFPQTPPL